MASMIAEELLATYDGRIVRYDRDATVFEQGSTAAHFHIVHDGKVKMSAFNDQGRELLMGYFAAGQSFGEPPFFTGDPYPASAIAVVDSSVWKIPREAFLRMLREHHDAHLALTTTLCERLVYKSMMMTEIAVQEAEHRLATLIEYFRRELATGPHAPFRVPFTRQQLADMTGLRVETVIRTVKGMEASGRLRIEEGRIVWHDTTNARTQHQRNQDQRNHER